MERNDIDLWDISTYDEPLVLALQTRRTYIVDYFNTEAAIETRYHSRAAHGYAPRDNNPHFRLYDITRNEISSLFESRTVRAWHYTRLTDPEVTQIRRQGIKLSTPDFLKDRLALQVAEGLIDQKLANYLIAHSPFQSNQLNYRQSRFWAVTSPIQPKCSSVSRLLKYWGGEAASFHLEDSDAALNTLSGIGRARVLELSFPLCGNLAYSAAERALKVVARSVGCDVYLEAMDVNVKTALPQSSILRIHTEGDSVFDLIGSRYPTGFEQSRS